MLNGYKVFRSQLDGGHDEGAYCLESDAYDRNHTSPEDSKPIEQSVQRGDAKRFLQKPKLCGDVARGWGSVK